LEPRPTELKTCLMVIGVLELFGCGPDNVTPPDDTGTNAEATSSEETSPADLPAVDPRWCVEEVEGAEVRIAMTDVETACDAELTAVACEAIQACTAVFGRAVQCPESGACATGTTEFLGCVPFTICKPGTNIYCRETQDYLLTYASQQGDCTPFGMMACQISPDYVAIGEPPPDCR
jgi:hypothetical protein